MDFARLLRRFTRDYFHWRRVRRARRGLIQQTLGRSRMNQPVVTHSHHQPARLLWKLVYIEWRSSYHTDVDTLTPALGFIEASGTSVRKLHSGADRRGDTHNGLCLPRSVAFLDSSDFRGTALCPAQRSRLTKKNNSCQQHNFTIFQILLLYIADINHAATVQIAS